MASTSWSSALPGAVVAPGALVAPGGQQGVGGPSWQVGTGLALNTGTAPPTLALAVPVAIANGGTGASSAASALTSLGALPISGGSMTGPLIAYSGTGVAGVGLGIGDNSTGWYRTGNTLVLSVSGQLYAQWLGTTPSMMMGVPLNMATQRITGVGALGLNYTVPSDAIAGSAIATGPLCFPQGSSGIGCNAYIGAGGVWKYLAAGVAAALNLNNGGLGVYSAPSGAAGANVPLALTLSVDPSGNGIFTGYNQANSGFYVGTSGLLHIFDALNQAVGMSGSLGLQGSGGAGGCFLQLGLNSAPVTTGDVHIDLGSTRTGSGYAYIDFHAQAGASLDGRIIRDPGPNGNFHIQSAGGTSDILIEPSGTAAGATFHAGGATCSLRLSGGYGAQSGSGGATQANVHNIDWTGVAHLWIDNVNQGSINVTPSDERLKSDIAPSTFDGLAAVNATDLYQFRWRDHTVPGHPEDDPDAPLVPVGFVAQRMPAALASTVVGDPEAQTEDGGIASVLNVDTTTLLAAAFAAIKQLTERLEQLEAVVQPF